MLSFYTCTPKIIIMYGSWDTEWDRQNLLSFWVIFYPFKHPPPFPNNPENQNFEKKWKMPGDNILLYIYMCTINKEHVIYGSWNIRCNRQKFLSFWVILCPLSSLTTWKFKILKLKITPGDIILHIWTITVCNFNSMKSSVELNSLLSRFFGYITWFVISPN